MQIPMYSTYSMYASFQGSISQAGNTILPVHTCSVGAKELGQ
jgi:hypothetical protein